jgi:hypothetical protein
MKIRNGFVSNSSSTCFLLAIIPGKKCETCGCDAMDFLDPLRFMGNKLGKDAVYYDGLGEQMLYEKQGELEEKVAQLQSYRMHLEKLKLMKDYIPEITSVCGPYLFTDSKVIYERDAAKLQYNETKNCARLDNQVKSEISYLETHIKSLEYDTCELKTTIELIEKYKQYHFLGIELGHFDTTERSKIEKLIERGKVSVVMKENT